MANLPDRLIAAVETGYTLPTVIEAQAQELDSGDDISFPQFNIVAPTMDIPAEQDSIVTVDPGSAPEIHDPEFATAPELNAPDVPALLSLDIPAAPGVFLPSFVAELPVLTASSPGVNIDWREDMYSSALSTQLRSTLLSCLQQANGYSSDAERAQARAGIDEAKFVLDTELERITEDAAAEGYGRLPGVQRFKASLKQGEFISKYAESNRKVAVEQMERERQVVERVVDGLIALDKAFMAYASERAERALLVTQSRYEQAVKLFKLRVQAYNADVDRYQAEADVYAAKIKGLVMLADQYRAEVQAQQAIAEGNNPIADLYAAQASYLETGVRKYRAQLDESVARLRVDKAKIEGYREAVRAYGARVEAATSTIQTYTTNVQAIVSAAQANAELANADAQKADAIKTAHLETLEREKVNLEGRTATARMNALAHESRRIEAERAVLAVKESVSGMRIDADTIRQETQHALAEIEAEISLLTAGNAMAAADLKKELADMEIQQTRSVIRREKTQAYQAGSMDLSQRAVQAEMMQYREHTAETYTENHETLDSARGDLINAITEYKLQLAEE